MKSEFTARVGEVKQLMIDLALQIAASNPAHVEELISQEFIKDPGQRVSDIVAGVSDAVSDNIVIIRFVRWDSENNEPESWDPPTEPSSNVVRIRGTR